MPKSQRLEEESDDGPLLNPPQALSSSIRPFPPSAFPFPHSKAFLLINFLTYVCPTVIYSNGMAEKWACLAEILAV